MKWIHLTDVHAHGEGPAAQAAALAKLVAYIESLGLSGIDFVFVTGDISQEGKAEDYAHFSRSILQPLRQVLGSFTLVLAPGNHDSDLEAAAPIFWDRLSTRDVFFDESEIGRRARRLRAPAFASFDTFSGAGCLALTCNREVSRLHPVENQPVDIIVTNTAWFSADSREYQDEGTANSPLQSLRQVAPGHRTRLRLILGHHPITWFKDREGFKSYLAEANAVYLHGHMHAPQALCLQDRLLALGFGATYQQSPDAPGDVTYKNSFTICQLEDRELHVQIHEWNSYGSWSIQNSLPAEFNLASNKLESGYAFRVGDRPDLGTSRTARGWAPPVRRAPEPERVILLSGFGPEACVTLAAAASLIPLGVGERRMTSLANGNEMLVSGNQANQHAVLFVGAPGHVLSAAEVERANTEIDLHGYQTYKIVTLGQVSSEAETLLVQLKLRKQIEVLAGSSLARAVLSTGAETLRAIMGALDAGENAVDVVIVDRGRYVAIRDRMRDGWFTLVDSTGTALDEGDAVVKKLKTERLEFSRREYRRGPGQITRIRVPVVEFSKVSYLAECQREFNSVRYAALAAVGLRFHDTPLTAFYVDASADLSMDRRTHAQLAQAIEDQLQGLDLDEQLREQFQEQILRASGLVTQGEGGSARRLYQQHGSLLARISHQPNRG